MYSADNEVCSAKLACIEKEMIDQFSRFAVPGQDPSKPVEDGNIYKVYDPRTKIRIGDSGYIWRFYAGKVKTSVSDDGKSITNTTLPGHILYDGEINRQLYRTKVGAWRVRTTGYGNNVIPFSDDINEWQGPKIFDFVDQQMKSNIERHRGVGKK